MFKNKSCAKHCPKEMKPQNMKKLFLTILMLGALFFSVASNALAASAGKTVLLKMNNSATKHSIAVRKSKVIIQKKPHVVKSLKKTLVSQVKSAKTLASPTITKMPLVSVPRVLQPAQTYAVIQPTSFGSGATNNVVNIEKDVPSSVVEIIVPEVADAGIQSGTFMTKTEVTCSEGRGVCQHGFVLNNGKTTDLGIGKVVATNNSGQVLWQKGNSIYSRVIVKNESVK